MQKDKFTAHWFSHSSIKDFLNCPRAYYLKNVYKNPETNRKIQLVSPPMALGLAVHEVLESLSQLDKDKRFEKPLHEKYDQAWSKVSGKRGGFLDREVEYRYKKRGQEMLVRVYNNPGPLKKLAVKIQKDLPYFWLSEEKEIILCGKLDWLEYLKENDSVHIIDFKTGKGTENDDSLQLPIYLLLASNCQSRKVSKASYWYLDRDNKPQEVNLPDLKTAEEKVLKITEKIKLARQLGKFKCSQGGCMYCQPYEKIVNGEAELVGADLYNRDVYILKNAKEDSEESIIL